MAIVSSSYIVRLNALTTSIWRNIVVILMQSFVFWLPIFGFVENDSKMLLFLVTHILIC